MEINELKDKNSQLFTIILALTDDESHDSTLAAGADNGLEALRKLSRRWDPSTGRRKATLLKSIIAPPRCKLDELPVAFARWQEYVRRYERLQKQEIADNIKFAALGMMAPVDLETHLMLNKHRLPDFASARDEAISVVEARAGIKVNPLL